MLDLAAGGGRHTRYFLERGCRVVAVDRDTSQLAGIPGAQVVEADLERGKWPFAGQHFDGIVVTNYLWRPLLPHLVEVLAQAGVLLYETFALGNERFGRPRNPEFLLRPDELLEAFTPELEVVAFEQGEVTVPRPAVVQRICATRGSRA